MSNVCVPQPMNVFFLNPGIKKTITTENVYCRQCVWILDAKSQFFQINIKLIFEGLLHPNGMLL